MDLDVGFSVALCFGETGVLLFVSPGGSLPVWVLVAVDICAGFGPRPLTRVFPVCLWFTNLVLFGDSTGFSSFVRTK